MRHSREAWLHHVNLTGRRASFSGGYDHQSARIPGSGFCGACGRRAEPGNADDLKKMMLATTKPQRDVWGMTTYNGTGFHVTSGYFSALFGAPNNWKADGSGAFTRSFETDEDKAAISYAKELPMPEDILISADSHVMEPHDLWSTRLPAHMRDAIPQFKPAVVGEGFQAHPGGSDPQERLKEMAQDGVSAEVLYPTLGLRLFGLEDAAIQEACFRIYNEWLVDYCRVAGDQLVGLAAISAYNVEHAVTEMEQTRRAGLRGAILWQAPPDGLPLYSEHYDPIWSAAEDLDMPIHVHIITGFSRHAYHQPPAGMERIETQRQTTNWKLLEAANALYDLVGYGILARHPKLRVASVENEIGWLPFFVQQWDYYSGGKPGTTPNPLLQGELPSFYVQRQVYATFFNDPAGGHNLEWWGQDNCMWSSDYPHPNSTWPNSRKVIERDLGRLPAGVRAKLTSGNVSRLYGIKLPAGVA